MDIEISFSEKLLQAALEGEKIKQERILKENSAPLSEENTIDTETVDLENLGN